jgi:predicted histone-like DNA-binding protein
VALRQLAKEISDISTVSTIDTMAVLEVLLELIPKHLADGKIVRLGEFGSFGVTVSGNGAETTDAFAASMIKNNAIRFRPGREVQKVLKGCSEILKKAGIAVERHSDHFADDAEDEEWLAVCWKTRPACFNP